MTTSDDEAALLERSRQGDREAFSTLVSRYASPILTATWRILGDRAAAEDVCQETFLAAYRALSTFRAESRFSTWLYRIGVNKCRDWLRAQAAGPEVNGRPERPDGAPPAEPAGLSSQHRTPEEVLIEKQRARQVERAIQRLAPLYREAFVLRHVEGLSYEEMADALGVAGSTLRMRVYKAREQLSQELAGLLDREA